MKTLHTKGKWIVVDSGGKVISKTSEITYSDICTLADRPLAISQEVEANAKLIAVAPDLLYALQNLIDFCTIIPRNTFTREGQVTFQKLLNKASNIIDKATE